MPTLAAAYKETKQQFQAAGIETPDLDARLLIQHVLGVDQAGLILKEKEEFPAEPLAALEELIERRAAGEPVSKILGEREFWGLAFKVTSDVLDPRPDSETLIEAVLAAYDDASPQRILDLGTGSGCLMISLLTEFPQAYGVAVDYSPKALDVTKENADRHDVADRLSLVHSNWFGSIDGAFDLIISNPPYITREEIEGLGPEVRCFDPMMALDGGADGLDAYRQIIAGMEAHMTHNGRAFFEIGHGQAESLKTIAKEYGYEVINCHKDIAGRDRVVEVIKK